MLTAMLGCSLLNLWTSFFMYAPSPPVKPFQNARVTLGPSYPLAPPPPGADCCCPGGPAEPPPHAANPTVAAAPSEVARKLLRLKEADDRVMMILPETACLGCRELPGFLQRCNVGCKACRPRVYPNGMRGKYPVVRPTNAVAYRREGGGSATGAVEGCRRTGRGLGEDRLQRGQRLSAHPTSHSTEGRGGDRPTRLPAELGGSDPGSRSVGRRGACGAGAGRAVLRRTRPSHGPRGRGARLDRAGRRDGADSRIQPAGTRAERRLRHPRPSDRRRHPQSPRPR